MKYHEIMKIIISPAKKMRTCQDHNFDLTRPVFEEQAQVLNQVLMNMDYNQLKILYRCSDKTLLPVYSLLQRQKKGILEPAGPALLSYEGIAFRYMAPDVFNDSQWDYINRHLRILSAMYGLLRPLDAIRPYRLEMQAKMPVSLYDFWQNDIADALDDSLIINLASREYSKAVAGRRPLVDVYFYEEDSQGKRREKGVYAKMARGAMVRFMAENNCQTPEDLQAFNELGYGYDADASKPGCLVFVRKEQEAL